MDIIRKWQSIRGFTNIYMAEAFGVTEQTWISWKRNPLGIPLMRLINIANILQIPQKEITGMIQQYI